MALTNGSLLSPQDVSVHEGCADELVSRVMKDEAQDQIVQVAKVVPPERPPERRRGAVGGYIPKQIEEEKRNVVQTFPQERGHRLIRQVRKGDP